MIALYFILSSIAGVSFFYLADHFCTKYERRKFTEIINRDNKTSHQEHSTE